MKTIQIREAKAGFSAILEAAQQGHPTLITRQGRPAAAMVPVEAARRLYPQDTKSFGKFLLSFPGGLEPERDGSPLREIDL